MQKIIYTVALLDDDGRYYNPTTMYSTEAEAQREVNFLLERGEEYHPDWGPRVMAVPLLTAFDAVGERAKRDARELQAALEQWKHHLNYRDTITDEHHARLWAAYLREQLVGDDATDQDFDWNDMDLVDLINAHYTY